MINSTPLTKNTPTSATRHGPPYAPHPLRADTTAGSEGEASCTRWQLFGGIACLVSAPSPPRTQAAPVPAPAPPLTRQARVHARCLPSAVRGRRRRPWSRRAGGAPANLGRAREQAHTGQLRGATDGERERGANCLVAHLGRGGYIQRAVALGGAGLRRRGGRRAHGPCQSAQHSPLEWLRAQAPAARARCLHQDSRGRGGVG